jgi:hypothetical protein
MICQCGTDISDPLRQFGPREEPLCWDCYSGEVLPEECDRRPERPTLDNPYMLPSIEFTWTLRAPAQEAGHDAPRNPRP